MAITVTARHQGNSGTTSAQTRATDSVTPTADSLLFVAWGQENDAVATAPSYQTPTGGSLTYTSVATAGAAVSYPWDGDDSFRVGTAVYRAPVGSSPSAFAVTVDSYSGTTVGYYGVVCFDITGHDAANPIVDWNFAGGSKAQGNAETGTITIDWDVTPGNAIVVVFTAGADGGGGFASPTAGVGKTFSTIRNQTNSFCQTGAFYRIWDDTEDLTITCSDLGQTVGNYSAVVFEVKAAAGGGATVTPAVIAATVAVPQATPSAGVVKSPDVIASSVTVPQAATSISKTVTPAAIVSSVAVPSAVPSAGVVKSPATIAATLAVPQATPSASVVKSPDVIAGAVAVPQAVPSGGAVAAPSTVAAVVSVPQAAAVAGGSATATPATIAAAVSLPAATPSAGATVTPSAVAAVASVPQAVPSTGVTVAPAVIVATVAIPRPGGSVAAGPATIAVVTGIPQATPQAAGGATVSPATIAVQVFFPQATAVGFGAGNGAIVQPAALPGDVVRRTVALPGTIR